MSVREGACEECGARVAVCDNALLLDVPAVTYDEDSAPWTIVRIGSLDYASVGEASVDGTPPSGLGHVLHEHQTDES